MPNQSRRLPNRANDDVHVLAVVFSARNGRTIPATPAIPASLISSATLRIHTPDCGGSDSKSGELNPEECGCGVATSPKPSLPASVRATAYTPTHTQSAVRTRKQTEGNFELQVLSGSEWEAVDIAKARETEEKQAKAKSKKGSKALSNLQLNSEREEQRMSRNRPRGPPTRDNGAAANEEIEMWNRIRQDIFKAAEKNEKQKVPGLQLAALKEKITKANRKATPSELEQMENYERIINKYSEEERAILRDEPADVIKNLEILIALRSASEADPQPRTGPAGKPRKRKTESDTPASDSPTTSMADKLNRLKSSTHRSASVSSNQAREAVSVKSEDGGEGTKGTAAEKSGHLFVGAEVVFKHNKKQQGVEGEGIQCIIKSIAGEGHKKRYDVQDPEPSENGEEGAVYKTSAASLIPIPQVGASLPSFSVGKQVLARYPDTTTFYRAEVMGSKKDVYRLKFEGEEDDKEMDVDRRFVLDIPGK
ncbi:SAGA-associated factor 29 [Histoplasma capsulatum var. duboisii H88]|uniref:SAGA-associated factor 29 n=3 Tax=Ajellomyces capsulatus TaxID=5037 RepID=F0USY7_AJEC8|nr:SAGA-associated factor 29 [Histoplasma capsulatum var. duboisii H88]